MSRDPNVVIRDMIKPQFKQYVLDTYNQVKTKLSDLLKDGLQSADIFRVTELAMQLVAKLRLAGQEKKAIVLSVVGRFVSDSAEILKSKMEELGENADEALEKISTELNSLYTLVQCAVDPFIEQMYARAPQLYSNFKKNCLLNKLRCSC